MERVAFEPRISISGLSSFFSPMSSTYNSKCDANVTLCDYLLYQFLTLDTSLFFWRHALNVQIFLKMHRSDYAEKQLRVMQQIDEDHTLTQLASAWLNLAVVCLFMVSPFTWRISRLLYLYIVLEIRVAPRYKKHILSSKISLRSIRWQVWSLTEKLCAACIWGILTKLSHYY